jgi:hypothetical protein
MWSYIYFCIDLSHIATINPGIKHHAISQVRNPGLGKHNADISIIHQLAWLQVSTLWAHRLVGRSIGVCCWPFLVQMRGRSPNLTFLPTMSIQSAGSTKQVGKPHMKMFSWYQRQCFLSWYACQLRKKQLFLRQSRHLVPILSILSILERMLEIFQNLNVYRYDLVYRYI